MSSLQSLVGSLCVFGFDGLTAPDTLKSFLKDWHLGGVILFRRNIESKQQLADLIREIKSASCSELPLFVSVDHEGGRVFRLPSPFSKIPTAREIGGGTLQSAFEIGRLMGRELSEVGFNLNFAPVLDTDTNPINPIIGDRAFSKDPSTVAAFGNALAEGLVAERVIPCGKHFPGHGDTAQDSHFDLPVVSEPEARLESTELLPFCKAIAANIPMLMTAHVLYPALDEQLPATLSAKILTGILRNRLGYQGVVISDDFLMKAIADRYGIPEAAGLFLEAGGDIPLICRDTDAVQIKTLEALIRRAEEEKSFEEKLRVAKVRIERLKKASL